eukprot:CAMPEP_0174762518 /NCGR_PEP_ID=MMETSP1094-20130205/109819_1 /TAXON_ID=156173 /ORGANISM="Chrysochromulina brevifilum, Strain UTEX LB 985" /LENGTH=266 /DNA_ID=CAMNT_0015968471 /DNA_START=419 /DNA_END=1219 /DNA_ORIENTATION=-
MISNWLKQPVPFPYFHALTLLLILDLLLIGYGLVVLYLDPYLTAIIYVIVTLVFLGLREVAVAMSDPFGNDPTDFEVDTMLKSAYKNAVACLQDNRRPMLQDLGGLQNPISDRSARSTIQPSQMSDIPLWGDISSRQEAQPSTILPLEALRSASRGGSQLFHRRQSKGVNASIYPKAGVRASQLPSIQSLRSSGETTAVESDRSDRMSLASSHSRESGYASSENVSHLHQAVGQARLGQPTLPPVLESASSGSFVRDQKSVVSAEI